MATLTVLCATRDPGPRVAAILRQVRSIADEIVVLANAETDEADLREYAVVADRLLRYEFAMPGERLSAWAHAQCAGDWVLTLHGDELLSAALIAQIPELIARGDRVQYWIPRRWCFPSPREYLDEVPWSPDYQVRLVRNDPATLSFPGLTHTAALPVEPSGWLEAPMYHLDLLVNDADNRTAKADEYEDDRPGIVAPGGGPQSIYYLPERYASRAPALIDDADAAHITEVLEAGPTDDLPPVDVEALPLGTRAEIDALWAGRTLEPEAYAARIEVIDQDTRVCPGETRRISLRVTNTGTTTWPGRDLAPHIRIAYRWWTAEGTWIEDAPLRTDLPCAVAPGETIVVPAAVAAEPGCTESRVAEFDLVHEGVRYFETPLRVWIVIAPQPDRTAKSGGPG